MVVEGPHPFRQNISRYGSLLPTKIPLSEPCVGTVLTPWGRADAVCPECLWAAPQQGGPSVDPRRCPLLFTYSFAHCRSYAERRVEFRARNSTGNEIHKRRQGPVDGWPKNETQEEVCKKLETAWDAHGPPPGYADGFHVASVRLLRCVQVPEEQLRRLDAIRVHIIKTGQKAKLAMPLAPIV